MRFSICNELFEHWEFKEILGFISDIGYDAIEVAPFTLCNSVVEVDRERRKRLREEMNSFGIKCSALHWLLVKPEGLHINHPDPLVRSRTADYLRELISFADDIDCRTMVFGSPRQRSIQGMERSQGWKLAQETFGACIGALEDRDVTIGLEPLRRDMTNFVNNAKEAAMFINEMGNDHIKLTLDVYAMTGEEDSPANTIREHGEILVHFHANDDNERGPGTGRSDYRQLKAALEDIGYVGYLSVEVFKYDPDPRTIAQGSLDYLRNLFAR
jgi:sugar phosphate isomerase/epimerase